MDFQSIVVEFFVPFWLVLFLLALFLLAAREDDDFLGADFLLVFLLA